MNSYYSSESKQEGIITSVQLNSNIIIPYVTGLNESSTKQTKQWVALMRVEKFIVEVLFCATENVIVVQNKRWWKSRLLRTISIINSVSIYSGFHSKRVSYSKWKIKDSNCNECEVCWPSEARTAFTLVESVVFCFE